MKKLNVLHAMCSNGWKWLGYEGSGRMEDGYALPDVESATGEQYIIDILGLEYTTTVRAVVACPGRKEHLDLCGHYGVLWVDAVEYECKHPYSKQALQDMEYALELAEENLLRIGIPFADSEDFQGRNAGNKRRRNEALRKKYNLEELEKENEL